MAEYRWAFQQPDPTGADRYAIQGGDYRWYLPDRLAGSSVELGPETQALLERVTDRVNALGREFAAAPLPALYATLLRSEGIASSRIEGVREDPSRVLMAGLDEQLVPAGSTAVLINRNIDTVRTAVEHLARTRPWRADDVDELHRSLLPQAGPGWRRGLVWISGTSPVRAKYVAPVPELVAEFMDDLVAYVDADTDPPLVQAALTHAQLETIHPWEDGNGRTGRALIQAVLARSGLIGGGVLPVSVVLGQRDSGYITALNAYRYDPRRGGDADRAREGFVRFFLRAADDAVTVATDLMDQVRAVTASWAERAGGVRAHSVLHGLLTLLADRPVLTVTYAQNHLTHLDPTGRARAYSRVAIGKAFARLEESGIVTRTHTRDRGSIVYTARQIVDLLILSERRLGSPGLDTVASPLAAPARRRAPELPDHLRRR